MSSTRKWLATAALPRTRIGAVKIDGPLADLPGGELKIAAGAEYRRETYRQRGSSGGVGFPEDLDRDVKSVYGELFVPIFGEGNAAPMVRSLALSLSGEVELGEDATEPGITRLFPTAWRLAEVGPDAIGAIGLPAARARAIHALAAAVAEERVDLEPGADPEQTAAALQALPGIGPWTASYVAMRALGWTDGFLPGDLVVRRALGAGSARAAEVASARWRPWRAYAVMHLWRSPVRESEGVP